MTNPGFTPAPLEIKDINTALIAAHKLRSEFGMEVWWRGHDDLGWGLIPKVFRVDGGLGYESNVSNQFVQDAPVRHRNTPEFDAHGQWLCLAQHYGLATRLLDWTGSVLNALFFACEAKGGELGALWGIGASRMNAVTAGHGGLAHPRHPEVHSLFRAAFARPADLSASRPVAIAFRPDRTDLRMLVQQAFFTIHDNGTALEDLADAPSFARLFVIPAEAKPQILDSLKLLGITRSSLFPDLESLARDLNNDSYRDADQPSRGIPGAG